MCPADAGDLQIISPGRLRSGWLLQPGEVVELAGVQSRRALSASGDEREETAVPRLVLVVDGHRFGAPQERTDVQTHLSILQGHPSERDDPLRPEDPHREDHAVDAVHKVSALYLHCWNEAIDQHWAALGRHRLVDCLAVHSGPLAQLRSSGLRHLGRRDHLQCVVSRGDSEADQGDEVVDKGREGRYRAEGRAHEGSEGKLDVLFRLLDIGGLVPEPRSKLALYRCVAELPVRCLLPELLGDRDDESMRGLAE
mmetsp:Transcript_66995/g.173455  ORF Transcript_66995/g.173455 Transcript_66995/m.173455 type:complete len:254 (-) Transcript_66995:136-897(-)